MKSISLLLVIFCLLYCLHCSRVKKSDINIFPINLRGINVDDYNSLPMPKVVSLTSSFASRSRQIPNNSVLLNSPSPKYVEKIEYYNDEVTKQQEVEASAIDQDSEEYYRPFVKKRPIFISSSNLISETRINPNEPCIVYSMIGCQTNRSCAWDSRISQCLSIFQFK